MFGNGEVTQVHVHKQPEGRPDLEILEMKDLGDNVFYGGWPGAAYATGSRLAGHDPNGLNSGTPKAVKSVVLRVTTVRLWICAVAAISASS